MGSHHRKDVPRRRCRPRQSRGEDAATGSRNWPSPLHNDDLLGARSDRLCWFTTQSNSPHQAAMRLGLDRPDLPVTIRHMDNGPKILAVIFDMDGVVTDSEPIHDEALTSLPAHGYALTESDKSSILGTTLDGTWRWLKDRFMLRGSLECWEERHSERVCQLLRERAEPAPGDQRAVLLHRFLSGLLYQLAPKLAQSI